MQSEVILVIFPHREGIVQLLRWDAIKLEILNEDKPYEKKSRQPHISSSFTWIYFGVLQTPRYIVTSGSLQISILHSING
jgi:hypothetical protein